MTYFEDPWIISSPSSSIKGIKHAGMARSLFAANISYQAIQEAIVDSDPTPLRSKDIDDILTPI